MVVEMAYTWNGPKNPKKQMLLMQAIHDKIQQDP
jgi:hypothetical protein